MNRQPTDDEIDAVYGAFDNIIPFISTNGKISGSGWRDIYSALETLSEYELWLGLCNLESAIFESGEEITPVHTTLFELFHIAYNQGVEAL